MAQTNYTPISLYYSTTASAVPTAANLVQGELAINTNDGKLYYEDSSGVVRVLASKSTGSIGGSTTEIQYNNAGSLAGNAGFTFDGTIVQVKLGNTATTQFRIAHSSAANFYADYTEKGDLTVGRNSWSSNVTTEFSTTSATSTYTGDLAGGFSFKPRGSTAVTIAGNGNLLVGTTSNFAFATSRLAIGYSSSDFVTAMQNSNASPFGTYIKYSGAAPNGTSNEFIYCHDGSLRFSVMSNGGISNYATNNVILSDRREKTNFAPAKSYLDVICAIPVQTFNYIDQNLETDAGLTLGVVAQDVEAVAPELVTEGNWGSKENPKMRLEIYQTDMQYALMKALQELKAEFDAYKSTHP